MKHCFTAATAVSLTVLLAISPGIRSAAADDKDAAWGTIRGQVIYAGETIPESEELKAVQNHQDQKHCLSKGKLFSEEWVVNKKNRGVRWVFVWLQTPDGKAPPIHPDLKKVPKEKVMIDQPCCMFTPRAVVVRQGQDLLVKNSAPVPHSVRWTSIKNPGGNLMIPSGGSHTISNLIKDMTPVKLDCTLHSWMEGFAKVVDHPYAGVADEDGKFEFKLAPAGEYQLVTHHGIWGPGGKAGQKVIIVGGGVTDVGKIELK